MNIPVLDQGFVELLDHMGDDQSIVEAARTSLRGKKTRATSSDRALIRYLMRHRHTSPFEMVEFKFLIKLPIFVARQMVRHRTASINEISARYGMLPDEFYSPPAGRIALQSDSNKQGSSSTVHAEAEAIASALSAEARSVFDHYNVLCGKGVALEVARVNLPLSAYTTWVWKMDLHNLLHFLKLRLDPASQPEIREYAKALATHTKAVVPIAWEAFEDYVLNAVTFSSAEQRALQAMIDVSRLDTYGDLSEREVREFRAKINTLLGRA